MMHGPINIRFDLFVGMMNRIAIDMARAITPPSLFGIDRRIAYANRKYHSGWMCTGVTNGFAGVKLSRSLRGYGSFSVKIVSAIIVIMNPKRSFTAKQGWNGILYVFLFSSNGLFDPVWCRNSK